MCVTYTTSLTTMQYAIIENKSISLLIRETNITFLYESAISFKFDKVGVDRCFVIDVEAIKLTTAYHQLIVRIALHSTMSLYRMFTFVGFVDDATMHAVSATATPS